MKLPHQEVTGVGWWGGGVGSGVGGVLVRDVVGCGGRMGGGEGGWWHG